MNDWTVSVLPHFLSAWNLGLGFKLFTSIWSRPIPAHPISRFEFSQPLSNLLCSLSIEARCKKFYSFEEQSSMLTAVRVVGVRPPSQG